MPVVVVIALTIIQDVIVLVAAADLPQDFLMNLVVICSIVRIALQPVLVAVAEPQNMLRQCLYSSSAVIVITILNTHSKKLYECFS